VDTLPRNYPYNQKSVITDYKQMKILKLNRIAYKSTQLLFTYIYIYIFLKRESEWVSVCVCVCEIDIYLYILLIYVYIYIYINFKYHAESNWIMAAIRVRSVVCCWALLVRRRMRERMLPAAWFETMVCIRGACSPNE